MSDNLLKTIQTNLNYPPLQKIDPNTQEVKVDATTPNEDRFSQAAIPAILTGLYKYSTLDLGAENILRGDLSTDWVSLVFEDRAEDVKEKVGRYAFQPVDAVHGRLNDVAREAVKVIRENLNEGTNDPILAVKDYIAAERNTILTYLPEALHMGDLLNDDTLDDNTHKMEGPVSSLMHKLGAAFSKPEHDKDL